MLEPAVRPILRQRWRAALRQLKLAGKARPWIVCPYPWFFGSLRDLADDRLIYFNLDPYDLYRPERAQHILRQESELMGRSRLIICLAQTQIDALTARMPDRMATIKHLPLAVTDAFINPSPQEGFQSNTVGYVGNLIDRVDWKLVRNVAQRLPEVEFVFVGYANVSSGGGQRPNWITERDEALRQPNVKQVPKVPQSEVARYYWSFAVSWIPYATDHIFNIGSCPTKIMDGLASGRPVISTDVPECRLYPEWITLTQSVEETVDQIRRALGQVGCSSALERSMEQVAYVRKYHTWAERARRLSQWVEASCNAHRHVTAAV
jgi:glycosyltransferase involved in cell wall biosynthesis